ncbi:MAG: amidohydrolase family protein [Clostridia bacterium]|nr:amidohydrolase family protein [Clostridia bacterium]
MVIDFHTHMFPDVLATKTIPLLAERSGLPAYTDGTVKQTLEKMKKAGVTCVVQQNIATNPRQMTKVNDFAIACNQLEGIVAFGSVHPEADNIAYELDRLKDAGVKGIKLHPDYQAFFVDDPNMQPVYEAILKRGFILQFHTGLDLGLPHPVHAAPKALANTLGLFTGEKVVFAHMAGFGMAEESLEHMIERDVYIDTSCSLGYTEESLLLTMLKSHPEDKILFATDCPWGDFETDIEAFKKLDLTDALKEKILHKNAEKLLELT